MAVFVIDCYIGLFGTGICRFFIWVELPVQRRLCPIFVRNVESPDIHECFRGLTGSQRTPVFGASHDVRLLNHPNRTSITQVMVRFPGLLQLRLFNGLCPNFGTIRGLVSELSSELFCDLLLSRPETHLRGMTVNSHPQAFSLKV